MNRPLTGNLRENITICDLRIISGEAELVAVVDLEIGDQVFTDLEVIYGDDLEIPDLPVCYIKGVLIQAIADDYHRTIARDGAEIDDLEDG